MANFNAGTIEGTLTLDRSPFIKGLRLAREQGRRFAATTFTAKANIQISQVEAQLQKVEAAAKARKPKVDIKVDADTDAAQRKLEAIEAKQRKFDFDLDTERAEKQLARWERQQEFEFQLDTERAEQALQEFERQAEARLKALERDRKLKIQADLDTAKAHAQLALLRRRRIASILVRVEGLTRARAQLAALGKFTIALSGAQVVTGRLAAIRDQLANLDKLAYSMGGLAYLVGSLASIGLVGVGNLISLTTSLGVLGGALIPLPVLLGAVATAVGVLAIAFTGWGGDNATAEMNAMQDALEGLEPAWNELIRSVRSAFWTDLAEVFSDFANALLPTFTAGLTTTATAFNSFTRDLLNGLAAVDPAVYENIFAGLASSLTILGGGLDPVINAFAILGSVGSDSLDRLATYFVGLSERFDNFITTAAGNGDLQQWIDNSAVAFQDLFTVFGQFGGIIGGLGDALRNAGTTTLGTLADTLTRIHEIVDSPAFQTGMTTIFGGMVEGAGYLTDALGPIGNLLSALAPTIAAIAAQIGSTLNVVITDLSAALSTPAFQVGLRAFFDGLSTGIQAVTPYLPQIAAGIGALGQVMGAILANVGPVLGVILGALGETLVAILPSILNVVNILGGGLMGVVTALLPALQPLVQAFANLLVAVAPIVAVLGVALAQGMAALITAALPLVDVFLPMVMIFQQLAPLLAQFALLGVNAVVLVLQTLIPLLPPIVTLFGEFLTTMIPFIPVILDMVASLLPLVTVMGQMIGAILPSLIGLFSGLMSQVQPMMPSIMELVVAFVDLVGALMPLIMASMPALISLIEAVMPLALGLATIFTGVLAGALRGAKPLMDTVVGVLRTLSATFTNALSDARNLASGLTSAFTGIKGKIQGFFSGASTWLSQAASDIIRGFTSGITGAFDRVRTTFGNLTSLIPDWKGPRDRDKKLLRPAARLIMGGFIDQIDDTRPALRTKLGQVTKDIQIGNAALRSVITNHNAPTAATTPDSTSTGTLDQQPVHIDVKVEVPNKMNEEQVGTHVATKLGNLFSSGTTPSLAPVEED